MRTLKAISVAIPALAAVTLLAACAGAPSDRETIDAQATAARTADEHGAIASQYQALAEREADSSANYHSLAAQEARIGAIGSAGRATPGHSSITLWAFQMRAGTDDRAASEARELAKLHRAMADDGAVRDHAPTR